MPFLGGKAQAVEEEEEACTPSCTRETGKISFVPSEAGEEENDESSDDEEGNGVRSILTLMSPIEGHAALEGAVESHSLRRQLAWSEEELMGLEVTEKKWRREAQRSVAVAEGLQKLIITKDMQLEDLVKERDQLKKAVGRLKQDNKKLGQECVREQIRAGRAETRLEELKEASRAAIKRNDSLMAQLTACRSSIVACGKETKELAFQRRRAEEAERQSEALRADIQVFSEALSASEASRHELRGELAIAEESLAMREDKYQEAVVAQCTLANDLREKIRKLEEEKGSRKGCEAARVDCGEKGALEERCSNLEQQLAASREAMFLCQEELAAVQEELNRFNEDSAFRYVENLL